MSTSDLSITDDKWRAIVENDKSYDGVFLYAVKTTGIFCAPPANPDLPKERTSVFLKQQSRHWPSIFVHAKDVNRQDNDCLIMNGSHWLQNT
ncbi:Ada metal-binding domain-containing protein [Paenibacillus jamilae]|uniref:Ada metal-binding domain-containing protein n=1 Tax=Paenibacillus jamilae TaxID=114136 RepID=UPI003D269A17